MKNQHLFSGFTNQYAVSKTLKFALKPTDKTKEHINNKNDKGKNLLDVDKELAEKYKQAKKIIDEYHKSFIHEKLSNFSFGKKELQDFNNAYEDLKKDKKNDSLKKDLILKQDELRKQVAQELQKNNYLYKKKGGKAKFVKQRLPEWAVENANQIKKNHENIDNPEAIIKDFKNWTNYFGGFNDNRKNIYTEKSHSTSIGYRLIHENLPKFLENIKRYKEAKKLDIDFSEVEQKFDVNPDNIFTLNYFNQCLTQEDIEQYNLIRGGQSKVDNKKERGINEIINLYSHELQSKLTDAQDEDKKELKAQIKQVRSCKLEELYKQILSNRSQISFPLENIKNDSELCQQIEHLFYLNNRGSLIGKQEETGEIAEVIFDISEAIKKAIQAISDADPEQLYIKNKSSRAITDISQHLFGDWNLITKSLNYYAEQTIFSAPKDKKETAKQQEVREKKLENWMKNIPYFSFAEIHAALEYYFKQYSNKELQNEKTVKNEQSEQGITKEMKETALKKPLFTYFKELIITKKNEKDNTFEKIFLSEQIKTTYPIAKKVFEQYKDVKKELLKSKKDEVHNIKAYLDSLMDLLHFLKPLYVQFSKKEEKKQVEIFEKDNSFYGDFDVLFKVLNQIIPLYNQTRNYLTKKPFSIEKYKLNFENSQLADGWSKNKETNNTCVLLMKNEQYYLGVMNKKHNKLFSDELPNKGSCYQKIIYKQVSDAAKDIHTLVNIEGKVSRFTKGLNEKRSKYCQEIQNIKSQESYKGKGLIKSDLYKFIDYYKKCAKSYWNWCDFEFEKTEKYQNIKEFTDDINRQGYKITFCDISESYINQCVNEGKLYLFHIYSKDFSIHSKGRKNLQTLYWKALFDENNLKDVVYKLNGEAELFFRKASIQYSDDIWQKGHHYEELKGKFQKEGKHLPIIKDRRYAKDTYLFHVPITCNFKAEGVTKFNDYVNKEFLQKNSNVNILGIDRGERHLAYYTLINQNNEILKDKDGKYLQGSFNNPTGRKDYHELLNKREQERDKARKSWGTIEKIKDIKEGYLSQVVHKIATLMIEHNAIVVFEDLNFGFKKGRFKVEKQVYQKFEKMLIDKLNYLVFKDKSHDEPGGLLNAFQLTAPFESFQKLGKQTGFIFYVPAYHTSKICPATGFVNLLYPRYETVKKSQEFFDKFNKICFNKEENYFEFHFNYAKFTDKAKGSEQNWIVCSYGKRLENFKNPQQNNQWDTREIDLTQDLQKLFQKHNIQFDVDVCIINSICQQNDRQFFKDLIRLLRLTLQMRNSRINSDEDWMISPVKKNQDKFFDSRKVDDSMPQNADANGAYHIALKGLWCLQQINETDNTKNLKLAISNKEWLAFAQNK